jgi:hypothetical protein
MPLGNPWNEQPRKGQARKRYCTLQGPRNDEPWKLFRLCFHYISAFARATSWVRFSRKGRIAPSVAFSRRVGGEREAGKPCACGGGAARYFPCRSAVLTSVTPSVVADDCGPAHRATGRGRRDRNHLAIARCDGTRQSSRRRATSSFLVRQRPSELTLVAPKTVLWLNAFNR